MRCIFFLLVGFLVLGGASICPAIATAEVIFESGTLGPTGISQGSVVATNISSHVFTGVRFELAQPVVTSNVGGHFVDRDNGTFFGAIVALDHADDFPDSGDFSTPDVRGIATLTFPNPSAEVFGELELSLDPGWYALVFGSGLFGTSGDGAAPQNNMDIESPSYIALQPGSGVGWIEISPVFKDHRFVVKGMVVPESATIVLLGLALVIYLIYAPNLHRFGHIFRRK